MVVCADTQTHRERDTLQNEHDLPIQILFYCKPDTKFLLHHVNRLCILRHLITYFSAR